MPRLLLSLIAVLACAACDPAPPPPAPAPEAEHRLPLIDRIAFGSCAQEWKPQPILALAAEKNADLFVYLGDNIYGDTHEMDTLRAKYDRLATKPAFQRLRDTTPLVATWDDHDFGWNDAGRHYPYKEAAKDIFLDFWQVPPDDVRRTRAGIYTSYVFADEAHTLQLILLDLRTFRDDLRPYEGQPVDTIAFHYGLDYWPHASPDSTLLGAAQWAWLETQLAQPADLRIIATSTQFGISWNGYEAWANFPHERERMTDLIRKTGAEGMLFISGDVHYAELSRLTPEGLYPLYDLTSSGITSTWRFATPNDHRLAGPVMENHLGLIDIDWAAPDPTVSLQIYDLADERRIERTVRLSELRADG